MRHKFLKIKILQDFQKKKTLLASNFIIIKSCVYEKIKKTFDAHLINFEKCNFISFRYNKWKKIKSVNYKISENYNTESQKWKLSHFGKRPKTF